MTANKMLNKDDVIKNDYAITKYVINKKINNNFVFPNTPAQLTLDDTCLFLDGIASQKIPYTQVTNPVTEC